MYENKNNSGKKWMTCGSLGAILTMLGSFAPLMYSWWSGRGIRFLDLVSTIEFILFVLALGLAAELHNRASAKYGFVVSLGVLVYFIIRADEAFSSSDKGAGFYMMIIGIAMMIISPLFSSSEPKA